MSIGLQLTILLCCLLGEAFFAGMETGVISVHRLRLRHLMRRGVRGAHILHKFLKHPDHLLGTTLVGTNICTVTTSVIAASLAERFLGHWGPPVSGVVMTLVLLVGCEYLPKAWFQARPASRAIPLAHVLNAFGYLFAPLARTITGIATLITPSAVRRGQNLSDAITRDDLRYLTRESEQAGSLTSRERHMIHGVFELTRKTCGEIMTKREDMVMVSTQASAGDLLAIGRTRGFSRLPVYADSPDHVVGIVLLLDAAADPAGAGRVARDYMRPPQFVRADTPANALLPRMRVTRQPIVMVTDEHSRVIGLVTLRDILEEIIGEP